MAYQDQYVILRAPDDRTPPAFGHVTRAAVGPNGLRFQALDPALKAAPAGVGLVPFTVAMQGTAFMTFPTAAEMYAMVEHRAPGIAAVRDWSAALQQRAAGVVLRVQQGSLDFELLSIALNGSCTLIPFTATRPLFPLAHVTLTVDKIHDLRLWSPPPAVVATPMVTPSQKVEVTVTRDTRLLNDGSKRYKKQFARGQDINPDYPWLVQGAHKAGMTNWPDDFQFSNPVVLLDAHWLPHAFTLNGSGSVDATVEAYGQGLTDFFRVHLSTEMQMDAKKKAPQKFFAPNITNLKTLARCIGKEVMSTHDWSSHLTGLVVSLHAVLGQMLRRIQFPAVDPGADKSDCPLWYYSDHPQYRPEKEKRARDSEEE